MRFRRQSGELGVKTNTKERWTRWLRERDFKEAIVMTFSSADASEIGGIKAHSGNQN